MDERAARSGRGRDSEVAMGCCLASTDLAEVDG
jgi:hypothetical protein